MTKVDVQPDRGGRALAYEAPDEVKVGDRVRLPLPWFLDNSSGWLDYPGHWMPGTVVGPSTYTGPCRAILGVEERTS